MTLYLCSYFLFAGMALGPVVSLGAKHGILTKDLLGKFWSGLGLR
jgi:hypothetical protein